MGNRVRSRRVRSGLFVLGALTLLLLCSSSRADLLFFKDGFVMEGQVKREYTSEFDRGAGEMINIPKGFFFLDDFARRIYFSPSLVRIAEKKGREDLVRVINPKTVAIAKVYPMPPHQGVNEVGDWNFEKWERRLKFRCPRGEVPVGQRLGFLTPYFARLDATEKFAWSAFYLTPELGPAAVRDLLSTHPAFVEKKELTTAERAARRFKYCDFFAQAGWYNEANVELERILTDLPEQKERVEATRAALNRLRNRERFEELKRRHLSGQHEEVRKLVAAFPKADVDDKILAEVRDLGGDYDSAADKIAQARRFLDDLAKRAGDGQRQQFLDVAAAIKTELSPEGLPRLETFLGQAQQAERLRKEGKTTLSANELLSLAATGWLLGSPSSESKPERALRLWRSRRLVLDYLGEHDLAARKRLLDQKDLVPLDEIAQMIPLLPPAEEEKKVSTRPTEMCATGPAGASTYVLQLPPEYRHSRSYPVLVVLHDAGEKAVEALSRWTEPAGENGYILVAPIWSKGLNGGYGFSEQEHATVLDALRDVRRKFNVDSDRVFLFGQGQGGTMAFDVGLSHPDQFAGVVPMSGSPELFAERYWRNGQHLPFYVINGDRAGDPNTKTRNVFNGWMLRSYPMVWAQYKGRGVEWFTAEVPTIFDWMRNKKREFPLRQLGSDGLGGSGGNEFMTMRSADDRFYWLSTSAVDARCCNTAAGWNTRVSPATLTARIDQQDNTIYLRANGLREVTVWLGRNGRGENMIDFDKQLNINVNLRNRWAKKVTPSLETLLEDLYQRGDRQRLFLAKVEIHL